MKSGKKVKLTFANTDVMPHNLLIVKPGQADTITNAAITMGAKGFENGFIPEGTDVLHHTKLLDHGKEEVLEFTALAPATTPTSAHSQGMGF